MIKEKYFYYHVGNAVLSSHIDAVHAASPKADKFTGVIADSVIRNCNASGIIARVSRTLMDVNRARELKNAPAIDQYRNIIRTLLDSKKLLNENEKLKRPYLHLALHGMRDDRKADFIIGTCYGESCSDNVAGWFLQELKKISTRIRVDEVFPGNESKAYHRNGDLPNNYPGYGKLFNTIQIEINRTWRAKKQALLTKFFSQVITQFDHSFT